MLPDSDPDVQRWTLDDIPWDSIRPQSIDVRNDEFYLVASASFMEATTEYYTRNLIDLFRGDAEITHWLETRWLAEELQHGRALRRYVEHAWPDFDWTGNYRNFVDEFSDCCTAEELEPSCSMELASRCVVEMGTASYYTTLHRLSSDPALTKLAGCIYRDEVRHYKHFYRYFRERRAIENIGRVRVAAALWRRLRMTGGQDSYIVLKHIHRGREPGEAFSPHIYHELRKRCRAVALEHFPHELSLKMLLKPLDLHPQVESVTALLGEALARRLVP